MAVQRSATGPGWLPSEINGQEPLTIQGIRSRDWPIGERDNGYWAERCTIVDDALRWEATATKGGVTARMTSNLPVASDFELRAKLRLVRGAGLEYGLFFRQNDAGGYFFLLDDKGHHGLNLWLPQTGQIKHIIPWSSSPPLDPLGGNEVGVACRGAKIRLFLHGEIMADFSDTTSLMGRIGLAASLDAGQSATIEVSGFRFRLG